LSIADSFGYGEAARAAATALSADRLDEDVGVQLLIAVRTIFQAGEIDRIGSAALVEQLIGLDEGRWGEWRRRPGDKSSRGYVRSQFKQAWAAYCASADTPTQSSKIIRLLR
jgi:hypothetical protein